eukprot:CAMPEP_0179710332 /NCGR_PEP_ID=MMETSP0937-20121108/6388_1 /TAXON_ID=548131 ORGANISM="Ostreococcus mediterraneus, Strain clade-D-RCC2593" /NCGR_SAMPLE_ID=MMETSP0937 /ASSEMBLY_ACC=CAM_ASM_000575 /LENGTH=84 /DNA_ID=CAMNT_0021583793 /DNA_START=387 /DNA_END=641 /DNA_ORIENTATION=+
MLVLFAPPLAVFVANARLWRSSAPPSASSLSLPPPPPLVVLVVAAAASADAMATSSTRAMRSAYNARAASSHDAPRLSNMARIA